MSKLDYVEHLQKQLAEIKAGLARAEKAVEEGGTSEKALAELVDLRGRCGELEARIEKAKADGAETWSDLHVSFREEMDGLSDTLGRFLSRHA